MKAILQVCNTQSFDLEAEWIHIFPAGTSKGADGRGPYVLKDPQAVIQASTREKVELVIDRDHAADLAPKGSEVRAAGWMKELQSRADGIWARVEWTDKAKLEVSSKEYRYISPVFNFDPKTGEVQRILRASLTNTPNLELTAVASMDDDFQPNPKTEDLSMNKALLAIAAMIGLANPESEDAIVTAAQTKLNEQKAELASVKQALGHDENATSAVVIATASSLKQANSVDPAQYVPMEAHRELASQLASFQTAMASEKAAKAVDDAITAGKVTPGQREWASEYAKKDLNGFQAYVAAAPTIILAGEKSTARHAPAAGELDHLDLAVCSQLNLTPEQFKETRKNEA